MTKIIQKGLSIIAAWATFATPLLAQSIPKNTFIYEEQTMENPTTNNAPPKYIFARDKTKPDKPKLKGTGLMALGIVFTSITGASTLITGLLYIDTQAYNCDKKKIYEDDPVKGDTLKQNRQDCYSKKKEYLNQLQTIGIVSVSGLALSIWGIVAGANQRSESRASLQQVRVEYDRNNNNSWNLVFQHSW